jgi:uncharacterized membrane protein
MRVAFVAFLLSIALAACHASSALTPPNSTTLGQLHQTRGAASGTFIEIDHPKGVNGTFAWSISPSGDVIGAYVDINEVKHGFLLRSGSFTTIDNPAGGHGPPGPLGPQGTTLYDINAAGDVTGRFIDSDNRTHGFVLHRGIFSTIDDPTAGLGSGRGTQPDGINDSGDVVGDYAADDFSIHGFLLHAGAYTTIDAPHAVLGHYVGTHAFGINRQGDIVLFTDPPNNQIARGFLLHDGHFTELHDPQGPMGTVPSGINAAGVIVGLSVDNNNVMHGMILCNGIFSNYDDPNAGHFFGQGTRFNKINARGLIAGWYLDRFNDAHGFLFIAAKGGCGG